MKEFKFTIDGNEYEASVEETAKNQVAVEINGKKFSVEIEKKEAPIVVMAPRVAAAAPAAAPVAAASKPKAGSGSIVSPLPGSIVKILVSVGQNVKRGDTLLTMESMKMENNIKAERDGVVKAIHVQPAQSVMQGDPLIDLE
ncbi:MAG: biotin/lipoyl-binding protein [Paludibacteraceae bacterium]|nr:biotin/lipoyl-binding protein [Paludibacteraceae bacterium]